MKKYIFAFILALASFNLEAKQSFSTYPTVPLVVSESVSGNWIGPGALRLTLNIGTYSASGMGAPSTCGKALRGVLSLPRTTSTVFHGSFGASDSTGTGFALGTSYNVYSGFSLAGTAKLVSYDALNQYLVVNIVSSTAALNGNYTFSRDTLQPFTVVVPPVGCN